MTRRRRISLAPAHQTTRTEANLLLPEVAYCSRESLALAAAAAAAATPIQTHNSKQVDCAKMPRSSSNRKIFNPYKNSNKSTRNSKARTNHLIIISSVTLCCLLLPLLALGKVQVAAADESPSSSSTVVDHNKNTDRSDASPPTQALSSAASSGAPSQQQSSIVASLSSAVASAAAAAAVAAAAAQNSHNTLSTNDARSLVSGSSTGGHHNGGAHRTSGSGIAGHLASRLVDTIPEVPYNILHNMKKLDHAAPFYNVPNKLGGSMTSGSGSTVGKESTMSAASLLSSVLAQASSSAATGSGFEQLSALFRSPLLKRLADGYGEFASEFRSLFKPPGASTSSSSSKPIKATGSSTGSGVTGIKLLRDLSVPALLMLVASSLSAGDWRPVRTRRKSLAAPAVLPAGLTEQNSQQFVESATPFANERPMFYTNSMEPATAASAINQQVNQQQPQVNLQPTAAVREQWPVNGASGQDQQSQVLSNEQQQQAYQQQQQYFQQQQQQQALPMKRSDEIQQQQQQQQRAPAGFSSLSSRGGKLAAVNSLVGKLFNANSFNNWATSSSSSSLPSVVKRFSLSGNSDQPTLNDKQRYLIEDEQTSSLAPETKVSLLSSLAHAIAQQQQQQQGSGPVSASSSSSSKAANLLSLRDNLVAQLISADAANAPRHATIINHQQQQELAQRRVSAEQRDLTKLLPESWREVVKRTMSTVQQQANTQWKSIEGQLANWVQDKLKTVATVPVAGNSPTTGSSSNQSAAPVANMLASMSSTALNILGLHKNNHTSSSGSSSNSKTQQQQLESTSQQQVTTSAIVANQKAANR